MSIKITEYKFDNTVYDLFPEFNEGFTYTYEDVVENTVTTRTVYSDSLPTLMRFGAISPSVRETALTEIININTSNINDMGCMFYGCNKLTSIDISNFDTSNVTSMNNMFQNCSSLTSLDVSNFDTSNVTDMSYMFKSCYRLTQLDVSNWDTGKVTDMNNMFYGCSNLTSLGDVSNWDTSNVTNMRFMFNNCRALTIDVSNFDTSNVTDMSGMFFACSKLTQLDLSNWDTNNATNTSDMFNTCSQLTRLDVSNWDTGNVTNMGGIFCNCSQLTQLDVSNWDTSNVTIMGGMFYYCSNLTQLDLSNWDISDGTNMDSMFYNCNNLNNIIMKYSDYNSVNKIIEQILTRTEDNKGTLDVTGVDDIDQVNIADAKAKNWNVELIVTKYKFNKAVCTSVIPEFNAEFTDYEVIDEYLDNDDNIVTRTIHSDSLPTLCRFGITNTNGVFSNVQSALLEVLYLDTSNITDMTFMFNMCFNLTKVESTNWDVSNINSMNYMFNECNYLKEVNVSNWDVSNVNNMNCLFRKCYMVDNLDVSNWDTSNVTIMGGLFQNCSNLSSIDVSGFKTDKVTSLQSMFNGCTNLTSLDVSNFNTSNVTTTRCTFQYCKLLTSLDLSNWDTGKVTTMFNMLTGCNNLEILNINNFIINDTTDISGLLNTCVKLNNISMNNSDYNSVNKVITSLPTRTADNPGTLDITRGLSSVSVSQINIDAAEAKYWMVAVPNKITEYKFNNTLYDLIPEFNEGFEYTCEDVVEEGVTTRTIYSDSLPTMIRFGGDLAAYQLNPNKFDSLLDVLYVNTSNIDDMSNMFGRCMSLQTVCSSDWDTSNVTNMNSMFAACLKLASLDVSKWDTSNVTDMGSMIASCYKLTSLDVSNWDTSNVTNMYSLFDYSIKLTSIDVSNWDTSKVTNMGRVFRNCRALTSIDVSNWDTSKANNMESMFVNCYKLASIDVSDWDTSNVTNMIQMFLGCTSLTSIDVSNFDTSNVTDMYGMFFECEALVDLDLSNFDISGVTTMYDMFRGCTNLTSLNLNNWNINISSVRIYNLFNDANNLNNILMSNSDYNSVNKIIEQLPTRTADNPGTLDMTRGISGMSQLNIDAAEAKYWTVVVPKIAEYKFNSTIETLPRFNEGLVYEYSDIDNGDGTITRTIIAESLPTYMVFYDCAGLLEILYLNIDGLTSGNWMFGGCVNLTSINTSNMNTRRLTNMSYMFFNCQSLTSLDVSNWDTGNVTDMSYMFMRCRAIASLDVSKWDVSNVTTMCSLFAFCDKLTTIGDVSNWDTGNVIDMNQMFNSTKKLTSLDVSNFDTSKVTNMYMMFQNCRVPELDVSNWDTSKVTNIGGIFNGCINVSQLDVSKWDVSNVTNMSAGVFGSCRKVTELDLSNWNTGKVTVMNSVFSDCRELTTIGDVSKWDVSNVTDIRFLFDGCPKLTSLDLSGWNTSKVTNMNGVFNNCSSIEKLNLSNWTLTDEGAVATDMFAGCTNLRELNISNLCKTIKPELLSLEANTSIRELNLFNWSNDNIGHLLINNQLPGNVATYSLRARAVGDDERVVYSRYISSENKNVLSELGWGVVVPKLVDTAGVKKIAKAVKDIAKAELEVEVLRATNVEAELQAQIDEIEINCDNKASKEELQEVEDMLGGRAIIYVTQVEYDILTEEEKNDNSKTYFVTDAVDLSHDHENKEFLDGLNQEIIDNKQDKEDINLVTENKNIVGAINEIDEAVFDVSAKVIELDTNKIDKVEVETLLNNKSDIIEFNAGERIEKDFAGNINSNLDEQAINVYGKINLVIGNDYIVDISIDITDNEGNVTTLNDKRIVLAEAYNDEGSVLINILDGKIMIIDNSSVNRNGQCIYYPNYLSILFNELIQAYGNNIVVKKLDIVEADYRQINSELFSSGDFHLLSNAEKQTIGNVLTKDNTKGYRPTEKYNPATKLYVDDSILDARPLYDVSNVVESRDYSDIIPITLGEGISYINIPNHINIIQGVEYNIEYLKGSKPNSNGGLTFINSAIATYDENKDCLVLDFGDNVKIFVDVYYNEEDGTFIKNENNHVYSDVPLMDYHYINKLNLTASDATPICDEFLKVFKFVTEEEKAKWNNMDAITLNGYSLWVGTTAELEAIGEKDPNTLYFELDDGTTEEVVQVDVVDGVLNLTDDKYQKTNMINGTELVFPNVNKFTEIHLYFDADEDMNLTFPDCKWRVEPNIEAGNSYEIVATYNTIRWLVNVIVYS